VGMFPSPCCGCHSCRRRNTTTNLPVRSCMRFSLLSFVELRRPLPLPFRPRALNLQVDSPVTSLLGRCSYGHIVALALALEHPTLIYASSPPSRLFGWQSLKRSTYAQQFHTYTLITSSLPSSALRVCHVPHLNRHSSHSLPFSSGSLMRQPLTILPLTKTPHATPDGSLFTVPTHLFGRQPLSPSCLALPSLHLPLIFHFMPAPYPQSPNRTPPEMRVLQGLNHSNIVHPPLSFSS
jgi:hypothetical protein